MRRGEPVVQKSQEFEILKVNAHNASVFVTTDPRYDVKFDYNEASDSISITVSTTDEAMLTEPVVIRYDPVEQTVCAVGAPIEGEYVDIPFVNQTIAHICKQTGELAVNGMIYQYIKT